MAAQYHIGRADQDLFAWRSQQRTQAAYARNFFASELTPVEISQKRGKALLVTRDEHPRPETTLEQLAALLAPFRENGTVAAGNASGINDGACALLVASAEAALRFNLTPRARIVAAATAGVEPRIMGMGPVPATRRVLSIARLSLDQMDVIELNEAFAAQALAVLRQLGLPDDAENVNPNGGAIALGHPLGMSGARQPHRHLAARGAPRRRAVHDVHRRGAGDCAGARARLGRVHPGEPVEVEVAAAEHDPDALSVQARRVAAHRGVRHGAGGLDDDLQHLPQLAHAADDRALGDREDVRDVRLDGAEGARRERRAQAVGDRLRRTTGLQFPAVQGARGIVGTRGLGPEHLQAGLECRGRDGCHEESAAADRTDETLELRNLAEESAATVPGRP